MHQFGYRDGVLYCEGADLEALADEYGTPLYVYSRGTIEDHYRRLDGALEGLDHMVAYAVKANSNLGVLGVLAGLGSGFDIVSGGELARVARAGGDVGRCTFAGVGKTRAEIAAALEAGIYIFNAESEGELEQIDRVAGQMGMRAPVALRVNPNVDAGTHKYISTGKSENKFGIDFERIVGAYERAARMKNLELRGLQMHIGSQLTSVSPFVEAVDKVVPLALELKGRHGLESFSVGGGIGIVYDGSLASGPVEWWEGQGGGHGVTIEGYVGALRPYLAPLGMKIILEPGRLLVGNAGVLVTEVLYEKRGAEKTFVIVDAGMNDLIRPALYEGHHELVPLRQGGGGEEAVVDVVGPVCETGDFLAQGRRMRVPVPGSRLAALSAGAYGFVMASNYNSRPLPAEVLVSGDVAQVVRARQGIDDLMAGESLWAG
jgi:diaminopimelate decarboxylase